MYIFLDESGNLGNKSKKDKYFVIAGLGTRENKKLAKCIVKVRDTLKTKKDKQKAELKYSRASDKIRVRLLKRLSAIEDLRIHAIVVDKETVFPQLMDKKEIYFNWIMRVLADKVITRSPHENEMIYLVMDKRSYGKARKDFDNYILKHNFFAKLGLKPNIKIKHVDSQKEKCIQAADFVAGAIHQRYRENKSEYFNIIKNKTNITELHAPINKE